MNKKLMLLPLLTVSLCFSCGSSPSPEPDPEVKKYTVNIYGTGELSPDPKEKQFTFDENDHSTHTIHFTGDELYTINDAITDVKDVADLDIDYENKTIRVTPTKDSNFNVFVNAKQITYTVHFHADKFCSIGEEDPGVDKEIDYVKNTSWKRISENVTTTTSFTFKGWSLKNTGYGEIIPYDYILTKDIDVYPSYEISVGVLSSGIYEIDGYTIKKDENVDQYNITFHFKINDEQHYEFPENGEEETEKYIKVFSGTSEITDDLTINSKERTIELSDTQLQGNIYMIINPYQPTYSIRSEQTLAQHNIKCTFDEENPPKKGNDYTFDLQTSGQEEEDYYSLPESLNIQIGGTTIMDKAYQIVPDKECIDTKAKVTIYGKYVTDKIVVNAAPKITNNYLYNIHNYGCYETTTGGGTEEDLPNIGTCKTDEPFSFKIYPKESGDEVLPVYPKNIVVSLDGGDYITVEEEMMAGANARFTYSDQDYIFTLKASQANKKLDIYVRNPNPEYKFLDELTWAEIIDISDAGLAKDLFYLGDRKNVLINKQYYTIKIIGFNHDDLTDEEGKKAHITFEFDQVISDNEGDAVKKHFVNESGLYVFGDTDYSKYLNKDFYNLIGEDLRENIKTVVKKSYRTQTYSKLYTYNTKIFPLSLP